MLPNLQQLDQVAAGKVCADSRGDRHPNKGWLSRAGSYSHFFPLCRKVENWYVLWYPQIAIFLKSAAFKLLSNLCLFKILGLQSPHICIPPENKQPHKKTCPKQQQPTPTHKKNQPIYTNTQNHHQKTQKPHQTLDLNRSKNKSQFGSTYLFYSH